MRNRVILITLSLSVWLILKLVDAQIAGPQILYFLAVVVLFMSTHSVWLLWAQKKWRRRIKRAHLCAINEEAKASLPKPVEILDEEPESGWQPSVDIFVAAKNESRVIESTVRNLFKLDYEKYLVWIIDDNSDDDMPQILERLKSEFANLRVLRRSHDGVRGKSAALNDALCLTKGEVIVVFDADAYIAPDFLKRTLPSLEPDGIGAVQVQKRIYDRQTGFLASAQATEYALDTYLQVGRDLIGGTVELRGNGELIKREALIDVGGWNNKSITDDLDLSSRLLINNWDIRFCPEPWVNEEAVTTWKGLIRQRLRWAEGSIRRYLDYIFPLNSPRRLSFVERLDTLGFSAFFFILPSLIVIDVTSEVVHYLTGAPTYGRLLLLLFTAAYFVIAVDFFIAVRFYRPKMSILRAIPHSAIVTGYVIGHWMPCIFVSLCKILFARKQSTWHPTEHAGPSATH